MNPEKLHDALNLLDEDLILPVERLRRRKPFRWQHLGALAACLAVVCAVGVFGYGLARDTGSAESAPEDGLAAEMVPEAEVTDIQSGRKETQPQNITPGVDVIDSDLHVLKMETVLVEVTKIERDRFTATVLASDRNYVQGDSIAVMLTESSRFISEKAVYALTPNVQYFSEGAVLVVDYASGPEKYTIIAECISFGE